MLYLSACGEMSSNLIFKAFVNEAARWNNNGYGGLNISAKRVVHAHASVDFGHAFGMPTTEEDNALALLKRSTSHSANMYPSSKEDKQSTPWVGVVKARNTKPRSPGWSSLDLLKVTSLKGEGQRFMRSAQAQA